MVRLKLCSSPQAVLHAAMTAAELLITTARLLRVINKHTVKGAGSFFMQKQTVLLS